MTKEEAITEKIRSIMKARGEKVTIEEKDNMEFDTVIDFPNWSNVGMPKVFINRGVASDSIHILHELIHLEKFFVDQYPIIACRDRSLHGVISVFKNIPEDYVAHKIIAEDYGFNPIEERWFLGKDILTGGRSDKELAADLIQYHFFSEFCPNYRNRISIFKERCKRKRVQAFLMFRKVIDLVSTMDLRNRASYAQYVGQLIGVFERNYFDRNLIYPSYFSKEQGIWKWNP